MTETVSGVISRAAIRIAAVAAIRDAGTLAGDNVIANRTRPVRIEHEQYAVTVNYETDRAEPTAGTDSNPTQLTHTVELGVDLYVPAGVRDDGTEDASQLLDAFWGQVVQAIEAQRWLGLPEVIVGARYRRTDFGFDVEGAPLTAACRIVYEYEYQRNPFETDANFVEALRKVYARFGVQPEGFGNTDLEALASGLETISS